VSQSTFAGRRVVLGVTGGIASYKAAWLSRLLAKAGSEVDVVLTQSASEFIGAITFEALVGRPVHTALIATGSALDHIRLAREASVVVVAPATADFMARSAHGRANDLLTAILLATTAPVLLVPAMNDRMWAHPATRRNVATLRSLGYNLLEPDEGMLAAGEGSGPGRMPEPETIFAHVGRLLRRGSNLEGKRVLVTAGPTREAVDPVRFISNRSSGKMGIALAAAAWTRGADVTLVAGPLSVPPPTGARVLPVVTTSEMQEAVAAELGSADVLIMAAAPSDYRPASPVARKLKRGQTPVTLALEPTGDILANTQVARRDSAIVVGFALETEDTIDHAKAKLKSKKLDLIVANDATEPGAGFDVDTNRVTLVGRDGTVEAIPLLTKNEVAEVVLDRIEGLLERR
jgi:phosphopantothenoylcysteine decarboxylase / phosphopantothenate---cysteine ligase